MRAVSLPDIGNFTILKAQAHAYASNVDIRVDLAMGALRTTPATHADPWPPLGSPRINGHYESRRSPGPSTQLYVDGLGPRRVARRCASGFSAKCVISA